ncbi:YkuS family protein [Bacillus carboniphilus]|uniref:UPF0180 protein LC087_03105 n=1 Tax=Bacillus carboniphilus TaxID=86663 RepID=A0ABY9JXF3_9BACI|nr:YkuS family protein [Bacillus carboniphilus]WLR43202.1 YkuS family protein [Bacillus carboniphilus]
MPKVGIEQSLTDVYDLLKTKGYDVVQLKNEQDAQGCECCVITGVDSNVMGIQNTVTSGAVINASGMTPDEICHRVEETIH